MCAHVDGQRGAAYREVQEVEHPSFEQRVARRGHGPEEGCAEDGDRVRLGLERFTESGEQVCLFLRVCRGTEHSRQLLERIDGLARHPSF